MANFTHPALRTLLALTVVVATIAPQVVGAAEVDELVFAKGHHEYTKDGSATLGFVTERLTNGKVLFRTCNLNKVEVMETDLRASKARCDVRPKSKGNWMVVGGLLMPAYAAGNDATGTKVVVEGKVIDVTTLPGWSPMDTYSWNGMRGEPVGFVYKESNGSKALVLWVDSKQPEFLKKE